MKYALLSDIHANLEALETVLGQLQDVEAHICLGDLVGYGPNPNECVEAVRNLPNLICIAGNHDLAALGQYDLTLFNPYAREAIRWTTRQLQPEHVDFLASLQLIGQHPPFTLVHGALPEPMEYVVSSADARLAFHEMPTPSGLIGHTHVAEYYRQPVNNKLVERMDLFSGGAIHMEESYRYLINIGSIGQPRDGNPKASFGIWNEETGTVTIRRIEYDLEATQRKMLKAGLPEYLAQRLAMGR